MLNQSKRRVLTTCKRCQYRWFPILGKLPKLCPACKTPYWNTERTIKEGKPPAKFRGDIVEPPAVITDGMEKETTAINENWCTIPEGTCDSCEHFQTDCVWTPVSFVPQDESTRIRNRIGWS